MVDEEHAVQVVDFVLDDSGQQSLGIELVAMPGEVLVPNTDCHGSHDTQVETGEGEATLFVGRSVGGPEHHDGVDQDQPPGRNGSARILHYDEATQVTQLRRS